MWSVRLCWSRTMDKGGRAPLFQRRLHEAAHQADALGDRAKASGSDYVRAELTNVMNELLRLDGTLPDGEPD